MKIQIDRSVSFYNLVEWLETNVGASLWKLPVVKAGGQGWNIKLTDLDSYKFVWQVSIDDQQQAVLFWVKWG